MLIEKSSKEIKKMETESKWRMLDLGTFTDGRGCLTFYQSNTDFNMERIYYLFGCNESLKRGMHAHKELEQVIIAVAGSCKISLDDGTVKEEFIMDDPTKALRVSNMVWREISHFTDDCVLVVIASLKYDENDYIRNYDDFIRLVNEK